MFFGQVAIDVDNDGFTVGAVAGTLTHGDYYVYSPTAAESLLDHLCDRLDTFDPARTWSYVVGPTGWVTLTASGASSLDDLQIYEALGFTSDDQGAGTVFAATSALRYCWFPGIDPSDSLVPPVNQGLREEEASQAVTPGTTVYGSSFGSRPVQVLSFQYLAEVVVSAELAVNRSLMEWWASTLGCSRQLLYIPGYRASDLTPAHACVCDLRQAKKLDLKRQLPGSNAYWLAKIPLIGV